MKKIIIISSVIFFMLAILIWGLRPVKVTGSASFTWFDKINHIGAYCFLTVLIGLLSLKKSKYIRSLFLVFTFGVIMEFLQMLSPGRNFSIFDILANVIGIAIGYFCITIIQKFGKNLKRVFPFEKK